MLLPTQPVGSAKLLQAPWLRKPGGKYLVISNGGIGKDILKKTFGHMQSEEIEGYACDLYYKLITIIVCTKWCYSGWWFGCHQFDFPIYWEFHHPNWLSYFSEGFKPPTRLFHVGSDSKTWRRRCLVIFFSGPGSMFGDIERYDGARHSFRFRSKFRGRHMDRS